MELDDKEIERLNNLLKETSQTLSEQTTKAITLKSENERLKNDIKRITEITNQKIKIINEVREILKFHLSNPSGTKNGWHIDIWNSEDINKLNENLRILDKENK